MSIEQISDVVKMIAFVVAGLWAAWTFHKLQRVRAAELDNNMKLVETKKSKIEHEEIETGLLRQQPQLAIRLNVIETTSSAEACKSFLSVTVTLRNEGEQNLKVIFDSSALTLGLIVFDKNSGQMMRHLRRFPPVHFHAESDTESIMACRILRAGQQRQMALAVLPVTEPVAYIVQFHALYCREPFDGEKPSSREPVLIDALEQTFHITGGGQTPASGQPGFALPQ
jgi:hypothetical protein